MSMKIAALASCFSEESQPDPETLMKEVSDFLSFVKKKVKNFKKDG